MTSPHYYIPSTSDYNSYSNSPDASQKHPYLNNKIMVVATVVLFCVIFFITSLHTYCKWAWRRSYTRNSNRRHPNQDNYYAHSSGLSNDVIAQLPTFTYRVLASSNLEAGQQNWGLLECAVCLSEFQDDERGRLLPSCKHSFHIECIDMWFYSHSSCPLCRAVVHQPTIATSPLIPMAISTAEQHQGAEELALHEAQNGMEATSSTDESSPLNTMVIPTGGKAANEMVQQSPTSSSSSSSRPTRCVPHITIEIPTRLDISLTSPGCISTLSSRRSRCASPHEAACSSLKSLKSPGLPESANRVPSMQSSKEKRSYTSSNQEGNMESPRYFNNMVKST